MQINSETSSRKKYTLTRIDHKSLWQQYNCSTMGLQLQYIGSTVQLLFTVYQLQYICSSTLVHVAVQLQYNVVQVAVHLQYTVQYTVEGAVQLYGTVWYTVVNQTCSTLQYQLQYICSFEYFSIFYSDEVGSESDTALVVQFHFIMRENIQKIQYLTNIILQHHFCI